MPHPIIQQLGESPAERALSYRALFDDAVADKTLDEIRKATNKTWVLGSDYFKDKIEKQIKRATSPRKRGGDRRSSKFDKTNRV